MNDLTKIIFIFIFCLIIRILLAFPGIKNPESLLFRLDTPSYLNPAFSLYENGEYNIERENPKPAVFRPPGFSILLSTIFRFTKANLSLTVLGLCLISALTLIPVYLITGLITTSKLAGRISAFFFALNITSMAHAPLFLSDTLFLFLIAWHFYFLLKFCLMRNTQSLILSLLFLIFATYTRRLALYIIFPESIILLFISGETFKKKIVVSVLFACMLVLSLAPWVYRNYKNNYGLVFDTNYIVFLLYNAAFVKAEAEGLSLKEVRSKWADEFESTYKADPFLYNSDIEKRALEMERVKKVFKKYPFRFIFLHLNPLNIRILLPDVATFFEVMGVTNSDRGTLIILHKKGILAATKHYFNGRIGLLLAITPLLLIFGLMIFGFFGQLIFFIIRKKYFIFSFFSILTFTFLMLAGPIIIPRYHLPVLPLICSASGIFYYHFLKNKYKVRFNE